jgi:hypothetical protein
VVAQLHSFRRAQPREKMKSGPPALMPCALEIVQHVEMTELSISEKFEMLSRLPETLIVISVSENPGKVLPDSPKHFSSVGRVDHLLLTQF